MKRFGLILLSFMLVLTGCSLNQTEKVTLDKGYVTYKKPAGLKVYHNFPEPSWGGIYSNLNRENLELYYNGEEATYLGDTIYYYEVFINRLGDYNYETIKAELMAEAAFEEKEYAGIKSLFLRESFDEYKTGLFTIFMVDDVNQLYIHVSCDFFLEHGKEEKVLKECESIANSVKIKE